MGRKNIGRVDRAIRVIVGLAPVLQVFVGAAAPRGWIGLLRC